MKYSIGGTTRLLGVMGFPVSHTLSPRIHNASFMSLGLDFVYLPLEVRPGDLSRAVDGAVSMGFRGFNLTMPHKEGIIPLLDSLDGAAEIAGAVNTVVVDREGDSAELRGYNTDGTGMVAACGEAGFSVPGSRVALVGAGGAAAAIALALRERGAGELRVFNRDVSRAESLTSRLREAGPPDAGGSVTAHPLRDLPDGVSGVDLVINSTSLGMRDDDPLPFDPSLLATGTLVSDAVYLPGRRTALLDEASRRGMDTVPGERMLLYQGVEAQRLWTGREPDVRSMDAALGG